jgi:hypothetical protein
VTLASNILLEDGEVFCYRAYAGFSGKLKTGALRAAFNKKFPNG